MTFTPQDIIGIETEYELAHNATKTVLLSDSPDDCDAHQTTLNTAMSGIDALVTHYDGLVKHFQHLRDAAKDKKRDLERDFDAAKRKYWQLRGDQKRAGLPPTA